ncbi:putative ribonuclease H-like domain-containing protein [Tanacetum coccineum]|uniref:Ribonuclease H-like domain-containing protein n=1 Tax=Tanacetum coccineum TaxID=301880 RepID=A0ABQ5G6N0_9ASTR
MLNKKLQTDHQNEMCYQLLKLMKMNIKFRGGLLGLKRLHGFLEVTTAQVHNGNYAKWFGINKWYQSFALRNFDLEDMELESTNSGPTAKLPILKLGEYKMWVIRIKQYFHIQDYALWEVIENGDSWVSVPQTIQENGTSVTKMFIPVTAEEKTNKKNDVKARSLLLMALPNEHQLTFSQYPDAKSMFSAIETKFGGNAATKKTQKTLLKQQYENFSATSIESLDSIFNRLQKIVSRLAILVVWMNKPEVETMSIDDLYNHFKIVEQKVKKSVGGISTASPNVNVASPQVSTASVNDNTVYDFMVENPNGSNVLHQDLEQIHEVDLEAMDLKYDKSKVECYNCHKLGHFARECRAPRSKESQFRNQDNTRKQGNNKDKSSKAMLSIDGVGFYWSDMAEEQCCSTQLMLLELKYILNAASIYLMLSRMVNAANVLCATWYGRTVVSHELILLRCFDWSSAFFFLLSPLVVRGFCPFLLYPLYKHNFDMSHDHLLPNIRGGSSKLLATFSVAKISLGLLDRLESNLYPLIIQSSISSDFSCFNPCVGLFHQTLISGWKDVTVSSKIGDTSLVCSFRRIPRGGIEQNQFDSLVELVRSVTIVPSADRWNWNLESTGIFSVASARRRIDEICLPNIGEETRWVKCVPIKINVLAWKIKTDALPTRFNISRRGIDIQDMSCPICDNAIESTDHLFFRCGLVRDIANKVLSWWNLDHANLNSYAEWKSWLVSIRMDSKLKKMFEGVWYSIWWYVWIYRNKLLFDERKPSKSMLIDNVIASSFIGNMTDGVLLRETLKDANLNNYRQVLL